MKPVALVLGASGRFSKNMIAELHTAGWETRLFDRTTQNMKEAAQGVDVIINGANPPYPHWKRDTLPFTRKVIEAAQQSGATVLVPGNVYCFGPHMNSPIGPETPLDATNELGLIRIEMECLYKASGVKTLLLRAGDFLDTSASGNWFDLIMAKRLEQGTLVYPGKPNIPHAWAYLPDMAKAAVQLLEMRDQLATFEPLSFPGFTMTGQELVEDLSQITNQKVRIKPFSWWQLKLAKPFWPMAKYLLEMRYLWDTPHWMSMDRFNELLPDFQPTDQREALRKAIDHLPKFKQLAAETDKQSKIAA